MKGLVFIIFTLCLTSAVSQNLTFFFGGQIANFDNGKKEGGVTVAIVQNGKILESSITASNGKYTIKKLMPANSVFDVIVSKPGFVSKKVSFNYTTMDMSTVKEGLTMDPVGALDLELFAERPGVDFSFLQTDPVASFKYNPAEMAVRNDAALSQRVKQKIEGLLKESEESKNAEKDKYVELVKKADGLFGQANYTEALTLYNQATAMQPKETHPQNRIREINALIKAQEKEKLAGEQKDKDYQNLITAADNLRNSKKYQEAIVKYNDALKLKQEQYPKDEVKKLEGLIAEEKKGADIDQKYNSFIAAGDGALAKKDYIAAKGNYENALLIKNKEAYPKTQIEKIDKMLADQNSSAKLRVEYDAAIAKADNLFKLTKFQEAKVIYLAAQRLIPSETYPPERIKICEEQLSKLSADKQKEEKINALFEQGQKLIDAQKFDEAKTKYKEIQVLDPKKNLAQVKLDEIDRLIAQNEKNKNIEADFFKFVSAGDAFVKSGKLEDAKQSYGAALAIKSDVAVQTKLDRVIEDMASSQAKSLVAEKYAKVITEADNLMGANKLPEARDKYVEASKLDDSQSKPKEKIVVIDRMLGDEADNDKKYAEFMKKGNQLLKEEKYLAAIKEYNNALMVKPYEEEPKNKAAEAERLEKAKGNEADSQFEKIISTAKIKIDEKEYDKAIELLKRAQGFRPEDRRPLNMLNEIEKIKQSEKQYADKLSQGEKALAAKDYSNALIHYMDASKLKPNEKLPIDKISEIKKLLSESTLSTLNEKEFADYFSRGMSALNQKKYDNALASFKMALSFKPNDQTTTDKIAEVNQILDEQGKLNEDLSVRKKDFDALVKQGDASFKTKKYIDAMENYSKANALDNKDAYVIRQIDEVKRLMAKMEQDENKKKYAALIIEADNLLEKTALEESKKKYQESLEIKPGSSYPKKKIAEIDALLNPTIVGNQKIEPLGDKFEGDASFALAQADLDRKNGKNNSVDGVRKIATFTSDSISAENASSNLESDKTIFGVGTVVRQAEEEAKQDLKKKDTEIKGINKLNNSIDNQMTVYNESNRQNLKANVSDIESAKNSYEAAQLKRLQAENYVSDSELKVISLRNEAAADRLQRSNQIAGNQMEDVNSQIDVMNYEMSKGVVEVQMDLTETKSVVNAINYLQIENNKIQTSNNKNDINATVNEQEQFAIGKLEQNKNNSSDVENITQRADEINLSVRSKADFEAKVTTSNVDMLEDRISIENDFRDQRRLEGVLQIQDNQKDLDQRAVAETNKQSEKRLSSKSGIRDQEININQQSILTQEEQKGNSVNLEEVKSNARSTEQLVATKDDLETKKTSLNVDLVNDKVVESNATTTKKQEKNQGKVFAIESQKRDQNEVLEKTTRDKGFDQKDNIENVGAIQREVSNVEAQEARSKQIEVKSIDSKNELNKATVAEQNRNKQQANLNGVNKTEQDVFESNQYTNDKQFDNSRKLAVETAYQNNENDLMAKQAEKNNQTAKANIENVDPTLVQKAAKNKLGQDYPEGVTEEKFSKNDEKGILKTIITRRIVVIDGHGDVYLRTQTTNNTTYSKNGEQITEYVWQKETQNGKLKRN